MCVGDFFELYYRGVMFFILLKKIILRYKYVSFDVFDTLLERDVKHPYFIFDIVGKKIGDPYFRKHRIAAEKKARALDPSGEVSLDDIYCHLSLENLDKRFVKEVELDTEFEHIHPLNKNNIIFKFCLNHCNTVYLVSDMYLPSSFIEKLLRKANICGYKKLFVSCEYKKNKVTSDLFNCLLNEENLKNNQLIHVGDSFKADFRGPRKIGIRSILIINKKLLFSKAIYKFTKFIANLK